MPSRLYPARPVVGVGVVVWRGGDVLLIRRGRPPAQGQWSLPGGGQELGETVFEAARREVLEETGLEIEVIAVVDVVDSIHRDPDGRVLYHYTLIDVVAEWRGGEPIPGDDAEAALWTRLDELDRFGLWRETERIIRLSAQRRHPA